MYYKHTLPCRNDDKSKYLNFSFCCHCVVLVSPAYEENTLV